MASNIKHISKRPLWKPIVGAILFTLSIICLVNAIKLFPGYLNGEDPGNMVVWGFFAFWCFGFGEEFSKSLDYEIDFKAKQYKVTRNYGLLRIGSWKELKNVDHVSVEKGRFKNFQFTLWNKKYKKMMVVKFSNKEDTLSKAKQVAIAMEVKLLDELTNPESSTWIEPSVLSKDD